MVWREMMSLSAVCWSGLLVTSVTRGTEPNSGSLCAASCSTTSTCFCSYRSRFQLMRRHHDLGAAVIAGDELHRQIEHFFQDDRKHVAVRARAGRADDEGLRAHVLERLDARGRPECA